MPSSTLHITHTLAHTYQFPSCPWASTLDDYEVSALRLRSSVGWTSARSNEWTNERHHTDRQLPSLANIISAVSGMTSDHTPYMQLYNAYVCSRQRAMFLHELQQFVDKIWVSVSVGRSWSQTILWSTFNTIVSTCKRRAASIFKHAAYWLALELSFVLSFFADRGPAYSGPPVLRPLYRSKVPAQGEEGNL